MAETTEILAVSRKDAQKYEVYEKWYANSDGLFSALGKHLLRDGAGYLSRIDVAGVSVGPKSSVENLRNPINRVVEFHATTILTGPLEDALRVDEDEDAEEETDGQGPRGRADKVKAAVLSVWDWSNLAQRLRVAKRHLARDGQFFWKVVRPDGKSFVYLQVVPAKHVTDYEADERGNVTYARIDVPGTRIEGGQTRKVWNTEIWRKGGTKNGVKQPGYALFAEVERTSDDSVPSEKRVEEAAGAKRVELGGEGSENYRFDFVPLVAVNAQDTGEKRPEPVYAHGLHLISWTCREATRLSDLMFRFNKAFKVIGGIGNDAQGKPLPPPRPGGVRDLGGMHKEQQAEHTVPMGGSRATVLSQGGDDISIDGVAVVGLPGNAQMFDATPNINYEAARKWIGDHLREVYEELPELLYYAVESRANQSGVALRTLIAGAISRAEEMQSNLVAGLVKADKMALTVAQLEGFDGFSEGEIGTYEGSGFDHDVDPPEILPLSDTETEEVRTKKIANAQALVALGVPRDKAFEVVGLDVGELGSETEGAADGDAVARAAQALARRSGNG
ncbi:MAG: hypothetical protein M3P49_05845 [Actinomycetota bacterium]|nr:hypothetical protein [Actinomycetota bacterium]